MKNFWKGETCHMGIGSMTQTMHAEDVLRRAGICTRVISAEEMRTGRGCAYGIAYPCYRADEVMRILKENGFRLRGTGGRA